MTLQLQALLLPRYLLQPVLSQEFRGLNKRASTRACMGPDG